VPGCSGNSTARSVGRLAEALAELMALAKVALQFGLWIKSPNVSSGDWRMP